MRLGVFHAGFDGVGGAELLAVEQAHIFRALGAEVRIRTFVYNVATWGPRIGSIPVDAYARCAAGRKSPKVPLRVDGPKIAWAERGLAGFDMVVAHNFPANAVLGLSREPEQKIWYCHEPPRWLHPKDANPHLWQALKTLSVDPGFALRSYARRILYPWLRGSLIRGGNYRLGQDDVRGVAGISEIWANSEFTRDNVRRIFGQRPVEVVYPIVSFSAPGKPRSGLDRGGLRVLTVTRLEALKNVDTLLRGFSLFVKRACATAILDVVGSGPLRPRLERLTRALGLEANVRFHGFLPDAALDALSNECDVFALLPIDEPFGMVFPEAAARGLVLLGPNHGGPREILDDGRLGQVADPLDPEQIADGLGRIWRMPDAEIDALRARSDAACRARFSREVIRRQLAALLRRRGLDRAPR